MNTRTLLPAAIAAIILTFSRAFAETTVAVTDVTARQRYPWNGLVDITCTVSGIDGETNGLKLAIAAVMPDTGRARNVKHFQIERDGAWFDNREVATNGNYRLLWDAAADLGPVRYTNMAVRVSFDAHEKVQLWEGGPYWATTNLGAEEPEDYGLYFWWGDTVGYKRKGGTWTNGVRMGYYYSGVTWVSNTGEQMESSPFSSSSCPIDVKSDATLRSEGWIVMRDGADVLAPENDAAQVCWGAGWRMPTSSELSALNNECDWTWTTQNGVNGYVVRGRGDFADASIFLPAAGYGDGTSLYRAGVYGGYWSSVPVSDSHFAEYFFFDSLDRYKDRNTRHIGHSVRPVQGFTE